MSSKIRIPPGSRRSRCRDVQMIELVKLYHSHRCLWDRSHPEYKNRAKRYQSLKVIGIALGLTSLEDVKKKIKSMRDTYTAEKNRMKKASKVDPGPDEVYRTKLAWYRFADTFFNGSEVEPAKNLIAPEISDPLSREEVHCKISPQYENQYTELVEMECSFEDQSNLSNAESSEPIQQYSTKRSKKHTNSQQVIPENFEIEPEGSAGLYPSSPLHDEFYYFGMNIASQLRTLPKINALVLQDKIHKLIIEERLLYESHTTYDQSQTESTVNH